MCVNTYPGHEHAGDEQLPRVVRVVLLQQLQVGRRRRCTHPGANPSLPIVDCFNRRYLLKNTTSVYLPIR